MPLRGTPLRWRDDIVFFIAMGSATLIFPYYLAGRAETTDRWSPFFYWLKLTST